MKQLYTLLFLMFFAVQVSAQDFNYSPSQVLDTELTTDTYTAADIYIETDTAQEITYGWELLVNTIPTGWSYSLCDYNLCYSGIPASGTMTTITETENTNGTKGFFKFNISPWQIAGSAQVQIYVFNDNDYNEGDTVTFNFNHVSSVGVEEAVIADLTIYPNPATDAVTIGNISTEITQIQVINLLGEVVHNVGLTGKSTEVLNLTDYESGIYFISYQNSVGTTRTEKLVIR